MPDRTPVPSSFQSSDTTTERQAAFIADLLDRKDLFASTAWFDQVNAMDHEEYAAHIARVKEQVKTVTKARASQIIESLLALPDDKTDNRATATAGSQSTTANVEAGRYAIVRDEVTKFYRVDRPTEGKWAGYTFVKVQASEEWYPVKGAYKHQVLEQIAKEPAEAMQRYGQELGQCGRCGRTLTDETSRALGIGPVCREEMNL
jgi:hypothetical protein